MPLLTPSFISDRVTTNPLVRNCVQCRDLVDEAKDYHLIPERRATMTSFSVKERCCGDVPGLLYAVGGMGGDSAAPSLVEMFDPLVGKWTLAREMGSTRSRVGVAVLSRRLYVLGGYNGYERLRTVEVFDARTSTWTEVRGCVPGLQLSDSRISVASADQQALSGMRRAYERPEPGVRVWRLRRRELAQLCGVLRSRAEPLDHPTVDGLEPLCSSSCGARRLPLWYVAEMSVLQPTFQ